METFPLLYRSEVDTFLCLVLVEPISVSFSSVNFFFFLFFFLPPSFLLRLSYTAISGQRKMFPAPSRLVVLLLAPLFFLYHLLSRIFWSGLNARNVFTLPLNFAINFSPVFIWLLIFKNAGLIPKSIRPTIHVALAYRVDRFMFSISESPIGCLLTIFLSVGTAYLIYLRWYRGESSYQKLSSTLSASSLSDDLELSSFDQDLEDLPKSSRVQNVAPGSFQDHPHLGNLEFFRPMSSGDVSANASAINKKISNHLRSSHNYRPYNCWLWAPPALLALSWVILNVDHFFATPLSTAKDIVSWFSYVIGHFCVPLFTAIWLYVFHAPGALRLFSIALGAQNIAGVLTHLVFPNAPPWFIELNGEHGHADYDTPGYAAGLIRAPFGTGTHMVTKGFHASPIVFGALPSLHSAMAVMCFFFVCYYSRWTISKLALFSFVALQWWATIYLNHHWRLDLYAGLLYSIVLFTVVYRWLMSKVDEKFIEARLNYDFENGSTMGMRVFRNTNLQNFFDPLS